MTRFALLLDMLGLDCDQAGEILGVPGTTIRKFRSELSPRTPQPQHYALLQILLVAMVEDQVPEGAPEPIVARAAEIRNAREDTL